MAFRVPETARMTAGPMATVPFEGLYGAFCVPSPSPGWLLIIIADSGELPEAEGWEHVSVHARDPNLKRMRVPSWKEMSFVKGLFWDPEDTVVQFHPAASVYVNHHPAVLHLWRHRDRVFPTPPSHLVGPADGTI